MLSRNRAKSSDFQVLFSDKIKHMRLHVSRTQSLYRSVQTCTDRYRSVQTCTDLHRPIQIFTNVGKPYKWHSHKRGLHFVHHEHPHFSYFSTCTKSCLGKSCLECCAALTPHKETKQSRKTKMLQNPVFGTHLIIRSCVTFSSLLPGFVLLRIHIDNLIRKKHAQKCTAASNTAAQASPSALLCLW